jgi:hypothetical protein
MDVREQKSNFFRDFAHRHVDALTIGSILVGIGISAAGSLETLHFYSAGIVLGAYLVFNNSTDYTSGMNEVYSESLSAVEISMFILGTVISLSGLMWALKIKGRDLRWIVIALVPYGWFIFLLLPDDRRVIRWGFHWRGKRRLLYILGIVAIVSLIIFAHAYNLPMKDGEWIRQFEPADFDRYGKWHEAGYVWIWIEKKDYSEAPLIIQLGGKHYYWLIIIGGFLLSGVLRKEYISSEPKEPFI